MAKANRKESGAFMGELALTLPFFLLGIYLVIWIGINFNARASFRFGLSRAVRLAATRGDLRNLAPLDLSDPRQLNTEIIPVIHDWVESGTYKADLDRLLVWHGDPAGVAYYSTATTNPVFPCGLQQLPPAYTYALVYLNESMRQSVGPAVRYPCDPDSVIPSAGGPGCITCKFLNPDTSDETPFVGGCAVAPTRRISMECRFRQPNILLDAIRNMVRLVSGRDAAIVPPIVARAYFELPAREGP